MPGQQELKNAILDQEWCSSCGMCVGLCPYIKTARNQVRVIYPCGLPDGTCYSVCPKTGVDVQEMDLAIFGRTREDQALGIRQGIYVARATSNRAPGAQYGGVTTALAALALEQGLVSALALTGGEVAHPQPVLARSTGEVMACAGSKYAGVPTLAALNQAIKEGLSQPGLVGRPCQVLAARKLEQGAGPGPQFRDVQKLGLVLGLFCFATLGPGFDDFLARQIKGDEKITKMDIPVEGMVVTTTSATYQWPLDDLRPYIPKACNYCLDSTSEWADVAVGATEYDPAWNTVLVRTDKGRELFELAAGKNLLEVKDYPAKRLPVLRQAALNKKMRVLQLPEFQPGQPGCPVVSQAYRDQMDEQWGGINQ